MRIAFPTMCGLLLVSTTALAQRSQLQRPQGMELCASSVCTAHLPTKDEVRQILEHPLFTGLTPSAFELISARQMAIAKRQARSSAESFGPLGAAFAMAFARTGNFEIGYPDHDAFLKAQSERRRTYLLPHLDKVTPRADEIFSSALRDHLDHLSRTSPRKSATVQNSLSVFLGNKLLECWRRPVVKQSEAIDAGGSLKVERQTVNQITQSCFDTMRDDRTRFARLIRVREWHPYLWDSMSKTYAFLRTFLTPTERAKLPPIPRPLMVDQNAFARVTGAGQEFVERTSDAVTAPIPKHRFQGLISANDYPQSALRRGEQGVVGIRFTVSPQGVMEGAELVRSSGSRTLDEATLRIIKSRISTRYPSFEPARDANGYPIRGTYDNEFTWSLR